MTTAIVVMAYGSPSGPADVATYYTDVRRGRPPSAEQLRELESRYAAIGGVSPLVERTLAQIGAIDDALARRAPGAFHTYYGAKHATPSIEAAVAMAAADGAARVVGVVLAPHFAHASVGEYLERCASAAEGAGLPFRGIERYGTDTAFVTLLHGRVLDALGALGLPPEDVEVCFTAHALPLRSLRDDDRYPEEIAETAAAVAALGGIAHHRTGWQSAGMTPDPWLGPDICVTIEEIASAGRRGILVCPCGFTSDHLEVLYDLDIVAARRAGELDLAFARTRSLNADPAFAALIADLVLAQ